MSENGAEPTDGDSKDVKDENYEPLTGGDNKDTDSRNGDNKDSDNNNGDNKDSDNNNGDNKEDDTKKDDIKKDATKIDLPAEVQSLFARYPRLGLLFHGKAKGSGVDGLPLGTSESFERELLIKLAIKGVTSPDTLATVLKARPNGHAAGQSDEFIAELIAAVLDVACPRSSATEAKGPPTLPFVVDSVTRFNADPPLYTLKINGVEIELTSSQLFKLVEFKQRFFDRLHLVAPLPSGRGAQAFWEMMVPQITAKAVDVTPLADGTRRGGLEVAIKKAIEDLSRGDSFADLRDGRGMIAKHRRHDVLLFTTDAIVKALVTHDSEPTREQIAQLLPKLGCETHKYKLTDGTRVERMECWRTTPRARSCASASTSAGASPSFVQPPSSATNDGDTQDESDDNNEAEADNETHPEIH